MMLATTSNYIDRLAIAVWQVHDFYLVSLLFNQVCAGHRPVHAWFFRIASVRKCLYACVFACVFACVCVCPPPRLLITSGMMWCDIDPIQLVK